MNRNGIVFFVFLLVTPFLLFAELQGTAKKIDRLFYRDSAEYEKIEMLYALSGIAAPTTVFPLTAKELLSLLDRVKFEKLNDLPSTASENAKNAYWNVKETLEETLKTHTTLGAGFDLSVEAYVQANPAEFGGIAFDSRSAVETLYPNTTVTGEYGHRITNDENLLYGYSQRKPMLDIPLTFSFTPWVFGSFNIVIKNVRPFYAFDYPSVNGILSSNIFTNMNFFDMTFPREAYIAVDGPFFNVLAGRTKTGTGWGMGNSGNLLLGSHLDYYDNVRIRFFSPIFAYTFQFTFFDSFFGFTSGSLTSADEVIESTKPMDEAKVPTFLRYFVSHRFEVRLFDRVNFSLNEGVMVHARTLQFQTFSPVLFLHNMYSFGTTNISLSVEIDGYIGKGFGFYAQWLSDQMVAGNEKADPKFEPQAFGYIAGFNYNTIFSWGMYSSFLEFVLTEPYLYLERGQPDQYALYRQHDYEWYERRNSSADHIGMRKIAKPIGYQYGPDAIVVTFGQQFSFGGFKVKPTVTYFIAGENNRALKYQEGHEGNNKHTPTGTPEHNLIVQSYVSYEINTFFKVYGHLGGIMSINKMNMARKPVFDFQMTLGATFKLHGTMLFSK